ncbi:MAG: ParB/RepB/Spo0J family partition protein [Acidobacteriota bacterium]|nr:ParB/RepB/Spo0J family partition protein [Acidobacteriota bacterium]
MSKKGLPSGVKMRHDSHYVEEFSKTPNRTVGKIIPINQIEPNPEQPRVEIGDLSELSSSIKQKGILEPLLVKPNGDGIWMIIAGERRWRAANLAGLREVPCIELNIDEKSIAEIALIENMQRKDLNLWEEADGLASLGSRFGYTHEEIAKKIGKSRTTVTESFAIAGLPHNIREKCRQFNINAKSTLLEIARQFDEKAMHSFLENIKNQNINRQEDRHNPNIDKKLKNKSLSFKQTRKNIFRYSSIEKDFNLEISFNASETFQKRDVLKALKEAFDQTKR